MLATVRLPAQVGDEPKLIHGSCRDKVATSKSKKTLQEEDVVQVSSPVIQYPVMEVNFEPNLAGRPSGDVSRRILIASNASRVLSINPATGDLYINSVSPFISEPLLVANVKKIPECQQERTPSAVAISSDSTKIAIGYENGHVVLFLLKGRTLTQHAWLLSSKIRVPHLFDEHAVDSSLCPYEASLESEEQRPALPPIIHLSFFENDLLACTDALNTIFVHNFVSPVASFSTCIPSASRPEKAEVPRPKRVLKQRNAKRPTLAISSENPRSIAKIQFVQDNTLMVLIRDQGNIMSLYRMAILSRKRRPAYHFHMPAVQWNLDKADQMIIDFNYDPLGIVHVTSGGNVLLTPDIVSLNVEHAIQAFFIAKWNMLAILTPANLVMIPRRNVREPSKRKVYELPTQGVARALVLGAKDTLFVEGADGKHALIAFKRPRRCRPQPDKNNCVIL